MLGVSEARGGLTNLVSVTCGGNLIVAKADKKHGQGTEATLLKNPSQVIR